MNQNENNIITTKECKDFIIDYIKSKNGLEVSRKEITEELQNHANRLNKLINNPHVKHPGGQIRSAWNYINKLSESPNSSIKYNKYLHTYKSVYNESNTQANIITKINFDNEIINIISDSINKMKFLSEKYKASDFEDVDSIFLQYEILTNSFFKQFENSIDYIKNKNYLDK